jgi:hypothetical protein
MPVATILLIQCELCADGFHGAAMATKSLDDYLNEIKRQVPQAVASLERSELRAVTPEQLKKKRAEDAAKPKGGAARGGKIEARLTEGEIQSRTLIAKDCLSALAYLDNRNINPAEFPTFPLEKIPEYRKMAKKLVSHLGGQGNKAVISSISSLLMNGKVPGNDQLPLHREAAKDLLDLLQQALESGDVDPQDISTLLLATSGRKVDGTVTEFAHNARELVLKKCSRDVLEKAADATDDPKLKTLLNNTVKNRQAKVAREGQILKKDWANKPVGELLGMMSVADEDRKALLVEEIGDHKLTAKDAREHLMDVWQLAQGAKPAVSTNIRDRVKTAIAAASPADCVAWLSAADAELSKLIWQQLSPRLERVSAKERVQLRDTAIDTLAAKDSSPGDRLASIKMLRELKDPEAAKLVLDAIPEAEQLKRIPRDQWPQVAAMLRELTGQKFGPREGQSPLETAGQIKQWRKWRSAQGDAK